MGNPFSYTITKTDVPMDEITSQSEVDKSLIDNLLDSIDIEDGTDVLDKKELTDNDVEYYIRRVKKNNKAIEDAKAAANAYLDKKKEQVDTWLTAQTASYSSDIEYVTGLLEEYAKSKLDGSKKKSIKFIEGTIGFRKTPDTYEYDDDTLRATLQFVGDKYLKEQPLKVLHAELKKAGKVDDNGNFCLDGQVIEGIKVTKNNLLFQLTKR